MNTSKNNRGASAASNEKGGSEKKIKLQDEAASTTSVTSDGKEEFADFCKTNSMKFMEVCEKPSVETADGSSARGYSLRSTSGGNKLFYNLERLTISLKFTLCFQVFSKFFHIIKTICLFFCSK